MKYFKVFLFFALFFIFSSFVYADGKDVFIKKETIDINDEPVSYLISNGGKIINFNDIVLGGFRYIDNRADIHSFLGYKKSDGEFDNTIINDHDFFAYDGYIYGISNYYYYSRYYEKQAFSLNVYDTSFDVVSEIILDKELLKGKVYSYISDYNKYYYFNEFEGNAYFLFLNNSSSSDVTYDNLSCDMIKLSEDKTSVEYMDCNKENVVKYFPELDYKIENNLVFKVYDVNDKKFVFYNNNSLQYYYDGNLEFEIKNSSNEKIKKVNFVGDCIILIKEMKIDTKLGLYNDKIEIFDLEGNLIQEIKQNYRYLDFLFDKDSKELYVLKSYFDGICNNTYNNDFTCPTYLSYDIYDVNKVYYNLVGLGNSDIMMDSEMEDVLSEKNNSIVNPSTEDIAIMLFILLLIGSIVIVIKKKKIEF